MQVLTRNLVLVLIGIITIGHADQQDEQWMQEINQQMKTDITQGIPDKNIPILDPLTIPGIDVNVFNVIAARVEVGAKSIVVTGLSTCMLPQLIINLKGHSTNFHLATPKLTISSDDYYFKGTILGIFSLSGSGHMEIQINNLDINCMGDLEVLKHGGFYQMSNLKLGASFGKINVRFDKLIGGKIIAATLNILINTVGKAIFNAVKPFFMPSVERLIMHLVNKQLAIKSLEGVVEKTIINDVDIEKKMEIFVEKGEKHK